MQYHSVEGVVAVTRYRTNRRYGRAGNFNLLVQDLVKNETRNKKIVNLLLRSADMQMLLVTGHHEQIELIQSIIPTEEAFYTITHEDVDAIISGTIDRKKFKVRLLVISFASLEKLVEFYVTAPPETLSIFNGIGGIVIGSPHKNIDMILGYAFRYHNGCLNFPVNVVKQGHGQHKYYEIEHCHIYDVVDNHSLLSLWGKWHEEKFERMVLLDPNPQVHVKRHPDMANVQMTVHTKSINQTAPAGQYQGVLNNLNSHFGAHNPTLADLEHEVENKESSATTDSLSVAPAGDGENSPAGVRASVPNSELPHPDETVPFTPLAD